MNRRVQGGLGCVAPAGRAPCSSGPCCARVRKHRYRSRGRCGFEDEGTSRETRQEATSVIQVGCMGLRADEAVEGKEGCILDTH